MNPLSLLGGGGGSNQQSQTTSASTGQTSSTASKTTVFNFGGTANATAGGSGFDLKLLMWGAAGVAVLILGILLIKR